MHEDSLIEIQKEYHGTLKSYGIGFAASLLLTTVSFFMVYSRSLTGNALIYALVGLALTQAIIQLLFFLHVGQEAKPRWETVVFYFMVLILLIISLGSLWVMHDLENRMMSTMVMPHD